MSRGFEPLRYRRPFRELFRLLPISRESGMFTMTFGKFLPLRDMTAIISVAVLKHICNLPEVVARSGLLLSRWRAIPSRIPSEGTILWRLALEKLPPG